MLPSVIALSRAYGERNLLIYQHTPEHIRHAIKEFRAHIRVNAGTEPGNGENVPANSMDRLVNAVVRGSSVAVVPLLLRSSIARCPRTRCPPPSPRSICHPVGAGVSRGPAGRSYRGTAVDFRIRSCCGTRRDDDVARNVIISQQRTSQSRTAPRNIITLVSLMIVVFTSVLYVDCALLRAPIILPTRSERYCRLARDERRRRWGRG